MRAHSIDVRAPIETAGRTMHLARPSQSGGEDEWTLIMPVPEDAPPPSLDGASAAYQYRDHAGRTLFYVGRYEPRTALERKRFLPVDILDRCDRPGCVARESVSGSKNAIWARVSGGAVGRAGACHGGREGGRSGAGDLPRVCSRHITEWLKAAAQADWSPLKGRYVTIWPDAESLAAISPTTWQPRRRLQGQLRFRLLSFQKLGRTAGISPTSCPSPSRCKISTRW